MNKSFSVEQAISYFALSGVSKQVQGSHSLEKSLNFCQVLECSLTLNVVGWKVFFVAFWLSKTKHKS